jgi:hypothetical protein
MKPQQVRQIVRDELERLVQSPADRELVIRALIRDELASLGGDLLSSYGHDAPKHSDAIISEPMSSLGGYLLERFGGRTVVEATAHADSGTSAGG